MAPRDRAQLAKGPPQRPAAAKSAGTPSAGDSVYATVVSLGNRASQVLSTALQAAVPADPDYPLPTKSPDLDVADAPLLPAEVGFEPILDEKDPTTFGTPLGVTRNEVAARLYGDRSHPGGFDFIGEAHVRLRSFDGVAEDVAAPMRVAIEAKLAADVRTVVDILKQRLVLGADEWKLLDTTVWWSSRSDLRDAGDRSYFDRYLDNLDHQSLTEVRPWPFSDITHTALYWLMDEAEEKAWAIQPLLARRSSYGSRAEARFAPVIGPMSPGATVGSYSWRKKRPKLAIGEWDYGIGDIQVTALLVTETTATRAEIALRNSPHRGPRVMIPGGDGPSYGYAIAFPRLEPGYVDPAEHWYDNGPPQHVLDWWWQYPGTVVIQGDEFNPEFGAGGEVEWSQRSEILARALAGSAEAQLGLDFDVLSLATVDQRISLIEAAIKRKEAPNAALIARIIYATPADDFPGLEHRLSADGALTRLTQLYDPGGTVAMIGRAFTLKTLESMREVGDDLEHLPEFTVGIDSEGYVHCADYDLTELPPGLASGAGAPDLTGQIGREEALSIAPGQRVGVTIMPKVLRIGSLVGMMWRSMRGTLLEPTGPTVGPLLPTQLVRVKTIGPHPTTRIVTSLEAAGMLVPPVGEVAQRALSATTRGYMYFFAATGLARAFGPALAEGLIEGSELRGLAGALVKTAGTEVGRGALVNTALIAGMDLIDRNRDEFMRTSEGREFLELYDAAMLVWIGHDVTRLITSGLVPRLSAAMDRLVASGRAARDAILPLRDEVEAMRRAIARYATPAEAAEAATVGPRAPGMAPVEERPGFFNTLRVARGEVASERLLERVAGTSGERSARKVMDRLGSLIQRSEVRAADLAIEAEERVAASREAASAARARLAIAQRAAQLRPDARAAFLGAIEGVMGSRPNSLPALTDLLIAAAESRQPTLVLAEVQQLVNRRGVTADALRILGQKARDRTLDVAWLNRTSITDETLDFLGRDKRTPWDLYRRAGQTPGADNVMRTFRTAARGAGAEIVAADEAAKIGTNVRRQVPMGTSEIDFEVTVGGKPHGLEVKGWTPDTWGEALDAAIQRLNKKPLSAEQRQAVRKIDGMLQQLTDARNTTRTSPYLGLTDKLEDAQMSQLRRVLRANGLGDTKFVELGEGEIKNAAQGLIGESLGIPRPGQ